MMYMLEAVNLPAAAVLQSLYACFSLLWPLPAAYAVHAADLLQILVK